MDSTTTYCRSKETMIEMNPGFTGAIGELRNFAAGTFHGLAPGGRRRGFACDYLCQSHLSGQQK